MPKVGLDVLPRNTPTFPMATGLWGFYWKVDVKWSPKRAVHSAPPEATGFCAPPLRRSLSGRKARLTCAKFSAVDVSGAHPLWLAVGTDDGCIHTFRFKDGGGGGQSRRGQTDMEVMPLFPSEQRCSFKWS